MIEYDSILKDLKTTRDQLETLIRASDDDVEVAHLYKAKHNSYETTQSVEWARECFDHPRMEVPVARD